MKPQTSPFETPLSLPALSGFYLKTGMLMAFEVTLRQKTSLQYLRDFLITIDEPTAIIYPADDLQNWPTALVRIYKKRVEPVERYSFKAIGFTPETVALFNNEYMDFHALRDLDTAFGDKLELVGHYLLINEPDNLNVMPARNAVGSDPQVVLTSAPKELMDSFRVIRATEFYNRFHYTEELNGDELKALGGIGADYHNWLFANAILSASLITARQAAQSAAITAEENRLFALQNANLAPGEETPKELVAPPQILDGVTGKMRDMTQDEILQLKSLPQPTWVPTEPEPPRDLFKELAEAKEGLANAKDPEEASGFQRDTEVLEELIEKRGLVKPESAPETEVSEVLKDISTEDEKVLKGLQGASNSIDGMIQQRTGLQVEPAEVKTLERN